MTFKGFSSAHFVPAPSDFVDLWLGEIRTLAELKVILYVIRRTFGWGKFVDRISLRQFMHGVTRRMTVRNGRTVKQVEIRMDHGTGLSKSSVRRGLKRAIQHGYLMRYMVCGRCEREIVEDKSPLRCPYCQGLFMGREQYYYGLQPGSTTFSALPREARFDYLRSLACDRHDFFTVLHQLLEPEAGAEGDADGRESVVELLSDFGFDPVASEAVADEALNARLTAEDVEAWIEHVRRQKNLTNPRGFLRAMLRSGAEPPLDADDPYRYITGKYADYVKY